MIDAALPGDARAPLVLRAEGPFRAFRILWCHPLYVFPLLMATPFTIGQAHLGGWWVVLLVCQIAIAFGLLIAGARRSEIRVTEHEVIDRRVIGTKRWRWDQLGCLGVGFMGRGDVHLVVCVLHDPSPHRLRGFPLKNIRKASTRAVIELIGSHGFPIEQPFEDAQVWWAQDPRGRSIGAR